MAYISTLRRSKASKNARFSAAVINVAWTASRSDCPSFSYLYNIALATAANASSLSKVLEVFSGGGRLRNPALLAPIDDDGDIENAFTCC